MCECVRELDVTPHVRQFDEGKPRLGVGVQFSIQEQLVSRNVERFRGGLVCKVHRLLYHSTLGARVMQKKRSTHNPLERHGLNPHPSLCGGSVED